ncbi:hypothetical protein CRG98_000792 [Punica granatum]|uniref:Uncharacterized protein n=1 Tax=Punica granatum TaxID=22663 RepID=A0A2I0LDT3_PUNGR|nr:hypothetical protein CRG98_000792 [Punica granatum]
MLWCVMNSRGALTIQNPSVGITCFFERGPSIGDLNPTAEVACTHRGCQRLWRWGRSRRLVASAPKSTRISNSGSRLIRGLGPPIGDPDPTLEVSGVLCGCQQPQWWG